MTEPISIGARLRDARRRRRISIERAAEQTRIRADYLMRMESDELNFLAPTYMRGFLRSYARFLGVDEVAVVGDFDQRFGSARADASQIVALERRAQKPPREPRKRGRWGVAIALASAALMALGLVGLLQEPVGEGPGVAKVDETGTDTSPDASPVEEPSESPSPSPSPSPTETVLALKDGIDLKVVAKTDRCWMQVYADGVAQAPVTLELGQSQKYFAENELTVLLGNAQGVELIVDGQNIGSPGGTVKTVKLPDDIKSLL